MSYLKEVFVEHFFRRVVVVQHLSIKSGALFCVLTEPHLFPLVVKVYPFGKRFVKWSKQRTLGKKRNCSVIFEIARIFSKYVPCVAEISISCHHRAFLLPTISRQSGIAKHCVLKWAKKVKLYTTHYLGFLFFSLASALLGRGHRLALTLGGLLLCRGRLRLLGGRRGLLRSGLLFLRAKVLVFFLVIRLFLDLFLLR